MSRRSSRLSSASLGEGTIDSTPATPTSTPEPSRKRKATSEAVKPDIKKQRKAERELVRESSSSSSVSGSTSVDTDEKGGSAMSKLASTIARTLREARNAEYAVGQAKYLRNIFTCLGLSKGQRSDLFRPLLASNPPATQAEAIELATALWKLEEREFQYCALEVLDNKKYWTPELLPTLEVFMRTKQWWDTIDCIASKLVGGTVYRHREELTPTMDEWIEDGDFWVRRVAILHQLKYKSDTHAERLFRYCRSTMHEDEFFIRKAIGWSLREYSKTDRLAVKAFVQQHSNELSALSKREASKYLG